MDFSRTTTRELLALCAGADDAAWAELVARMRPVLLGFARRVGLDEHDAEDVAQNALLESYKALRAGRYDRGRGRLKRFLISVAHNRAIDRVRSRYRLVRQAEPEALEAIPDPSVDPERLFDEEHRRHILRVAMHRLVHESGFSRTALLAFERVHLDGRPPAEVARELGVAPQVVYNANLRCKERYRRLVEEVASQYSLED